MVEKSEGEKKVAALPTKESLKLSPEVEGFLVSLNPDIPLVFRQQTRLAAQYIQELDTNPQMASPEAKVFAEQLASTGFIGLVHLKLGGQYLHGDPEKLLPKWLYPQTKPVTGNQGQKKEPVPYAQIAKAFESFVKTRGLIAFVGQYGVYYGFPSHNEPLPDSHHFKCYLERDLLSGLESGSLNKALDELIQKGINPYDMKLHDGFRLVFYFNYPIDRFREADEVLRKYGLITRGPAQDVSIVRVTPDKKLKEEGIDSNDNALGEGGGVNPYRYEVSPEYSARKFLENYLKMCLYSGKNPALPYTTSFVYLVDYQKQIPPEQIKIAEFLGEKLVDFSVCCVANRRELADQLTLSPEERAKKEAEWQPKQLPGDLVFEYVSSLIKNTRNLPEDVRIMLSAWQSSSDQKVRNAARVICQKYGGVPEGKGVEGRSIGDVVFNFVNQRIKTGNITGEELKLLTPWLGCPIEAGRRNLTLGDIAYLLLKTGKRKEG